MRWLNPRFNNGATPTLVFLADLCCKAHSTQTQTIVRELSPILYRRFGGCLGFLSVSGQLANREFCIQ